MELPASTSLTADDILMVNIPLIDPIFADGDWLVPVLIVGTIAILFFLFLLRSGQFFPYEKIDQLCTRTELKFYKQLAEVVGDRFVIFGKIRIADLLKVKKGTRKRMSWQNKINCKHIDFVLCDPESLETQVAIELDDKSHQREDRIQRDQFVNQAFEDSQFPILRIKTQDQYDLKKIDQAIQKATDQRNKSYVIHID